MKISRRNLLGLAGLGVVPQTSAAVATTRLKVLVAGGHPGDPECGCGGTIARYAKLRHEVVILYLNRGEGYCNQADKTQCGSVRTAEAQAACGVLKARPAFLTQYDGRAVVDNSRYDEVARLLRSEKPDVLFVHWPLDTHRDHRAMSTLITDAWLGTGKKAALYFYEVADDTMMFSPTEFVDISQVEDKRRSACYEHLSQQPDKWYPKQAQITHFRGTESGCLQAEAFVRHWESKQGLLP